MIYGDGHRVSVLTLKDAIQEEFRYVHDRHLNCLNYETSNIRGLYVKVKFIHDIYTRDQT